MLKETAREEHLGSLGDHNVDRMAPRLPRKIQSRHQTAFEKQLVTAWMPRLVEGAGRAAIFSATALCVGGAVAIIVDTAIMIIIFFQPLFFGDAWNTVDHYKLFTDGDYNLSYLFSQSNEHRIVFPRLIFLLDFILDKGMNEINLATIFAIQLIHAMIFAFIRLYRIKKCDYVSLIAISCVCILLFSLAQHENFYWGFQVQFVGVYAAATLALWWFARALEPRTDVKTSNIYLSASFIMAVIATYTMSNGIFSLIVMIVLSILNKARLYIVISATSMFLLLSWFYFYDFHFVEIHSTPEYALTHTMDFVIYILVYLGAPVGSFGYGAAQILGFAGLILTLFSVVRMAIRKDDGAARTALVGVMLFIAATAVVTAFGRASFGLEQALSSRYFTPSAVFWSAQILYWSSFVDTKHGHWVALPIFVVIFLVTVGGAVDEHFMLRRHQEKQFHDLNLGSDALLSGVNLADAAALIFVDPDPLSRLAPFLDQQHLSIFSWPEARLRGMRFTEALDKIDDQACLGAFETAEIPPEGDGAAVSGWAWDRNNGSAVERIVLINPDNAIVGFASGGWDRRDVRARSPQIGNRRVGWKGFAKLSSPGPLRAYALLDHGRTACLLGVHAAPVTPPGIDLRPVDIDFSAVGSGFDARHFSSGGWTLNGQHPSVGAPAVPGTIYGSWSGDDAHQGDITIGPFNAPAGAFILPMVTGPSTGGQSVTVKDAETGEIYAHFQPRVRRVWRALRFTLPAEKATRPLLVIVADRGSDFGQWVAIDDLHALNP
jgi:hypothetical protein